MAANVIEIINVLDNRSDLIQLLQQGSNNQNCLANHTDTSQATVSRALSQLQELNIVKKTDETYELTLFGEMMIQKYNCWKSEVDDLYLASEILNELPANTSLDPAVLNEAQITTAKPHSPDSPLLPVINTIKKSNHVFGMTSSIHISIVEALHNKIEDGLDVEFIITEAVGEQASKEYNTWGTKYIQSDLIDLYMISSEIPFNLIIAYTEKETYTIIIVCSQTKIVGSILTKDDSANEWAQNIYQQFKSTANPCELSRDEFESV